MKNFVQLAGLLILGVSQAVFASPAGVIPYACVGKDILVLMAFDPASGRLGYGAFGGSREGAESIAETAAREFHEETRCAFDGPAAEHLETLSFSNSNGFYSYVAEVPYKPALDIEMHACDAQLERAGWQWFSLDDLVDSLNSGDERPAIKVFASDLEITLWDKAAESLRKAMQDQLLVPGALCWK